MQILFRPSVWKLWDILMFGKLGDFDTWDKHWLQFMDKLEVGFPISATLLMQFRISPSSGVKSRATVISRQLRMWHKSEIITCYLWLAICFLLSESFYLKLATTCKNWFLSLVVVRLVIFCIILTEFTILIQNYKIWWRAEL